VLAILRSCDLSVLACFPWEYHPFVSAITRNRDFSHRIQVRAPVRCLTSLVTQFSKLVAFTPTSRWHGKKRVNVTTLR
jgi:hypothetical protein